jgi:hypothetical protein
MVSGTYVKIKVSKVWLQFSTSGYFEFQRVGYLILKLENFENRGGSGVLRFLRDADSAGQIQNRNRIGSTVNTTFC